LDSYFILDSGATEHWTPHKKWLQNYINDKKIIYLANNTQIEALKYGNIDVQVYDEIKKKYNFITITKVYYALEITTNLLSIKQIIDKGWQLSAKKELLNISNKDITLTARWVDNLCRLQFKILQKRLLLSSIYITPELLHERLGHANNNYIIKTASIVKGLSIIQ